MLHLMPQHFPLPKLTLPDNGWAYTFVGDIPADSKHSDMSCRSCWMMYVPSMYLISSLTSEFLLCSLAESLFLHVGYHFWPDPILILLFWYVLCNSNVTSWKKPKIKGKRKILKNKNIQTMVSPHFIQCYLK